MPRTDFVQLSSDGFVSHDHVPSARSSSGSHAALDFPRISHQMTLLLSSRLPVLWCNHQVAVKVSCSASGSQLAVPVPATPAMPAASAEALSTAVIEPARPGTLSQSQLDAGTSAHSSAQVDPQPALHQVPHTMRDALAVFAGSTSPRLIVAGILSLLVWRARLPFRSADLIGECERSVTAFALIALPAAQHRSAQMLTCCVLAQSLAASQRFGCFRSTFCTRRPYTATFTGSVSSYAMCARAAIVLC